MSDFREKILRGEKPTDEDWNKYLKEAHLLTPSMTSSAFASHPTTEGPTSYEILANTVRSNVQTVLDLACGDGYLIQHLLKRINSAGSAIGVDMSEGELEVARQHYGQHPQVKFYQSHAQELPLQEGTVDCIVCHMAFMLMLPLDPVVGEIQRVLKQKGVFSAVIGNPGVESGVYKEIRKISSSFIQKNYSTKGVRTGDGRVQSLEGLSELFNKNTGFAEPIEIRDFAVKVKTNSQGVWNFMKDMYFISMLSAIEKEELEILIREYADNHLDQEKQLEFEFPMRLFTVEKL